MACEPKYSPRILLTIDGSKDLIGLSAKVSDGYEGTAMGSPREFKFGDKVFQGYTTLVYTTNATTNSYRVALNFNLLHKAY